MKLPRLTVGDMIEVYWTDSHFCGESGWKSIEEMEDGGREVTIKSVCMYMGRHKKYIYSVSDKSTDEELETGVMRDLKIPIGCITEIYKLRRE